MCKAKAVFYMSCGAAACMATMKMMESKKAKDFIKDLERKKNKTYRFVRSMM